MLSQDVLEGETTLTRIKPEAFLQGVLRGQKGFSYTYT